MDSYVLWIVVGVGLLLFVGFSMVQSAIESASRARREEFERLNDKLGDILQELGEIAAASSLIENHVDPERVTRESELEWLRGFADEEQKGESDGAEREPNDTSQK